MTLRKESFVHEAFGHHHLDLVHLHQVVESDDCLLSVLRLRAHRVVVHPKISECRREILGRLVTLDLVKAEV